MENKIFIKLTLTLVEPFLPLDHFIDMNKYAQIYLSEFSSRLASTEEGASQSAYGLIKNKFKELFSRPSHGMFANSPSEYLRRFKELEGKKQAPALASN